MLFIKTAYPVENNDEDDDVGKDDAGKNWFFYSIYYNITIYFINTLIVKTPNRQILHIRFGKFK